MPSYQKERLTYFLSWIEGYLYNLTDDPEERNTILNTSLMWFDYKELAETGRGSFNLKYRATPNGPDVGKRVFDYISEIEIDPEMGDEYFSGIEIDRIDRWLHFLFGRCPSIRHLKLLSYMNRAYREAVKRDHFFQDKELSTLRQEDIFPGAFEKKEEDRTMAEDMFVTGRILREGSDYEFDLE
jgi:hypothetical protein